LCKKNTVWGQEVAVQIRALDEEAFGQTIVLPMVRVAADEDAVGLAAEYLIKLGGPMWEGHRFWSIPDGIYQTRDGRFVHVLALLAAESDNLAVVIDRDSGFVIGHRFMPFPFYRDRADQGP
jgi:hypothetical protein